MVKSGARPLISGRAKPLIAAGAKETRLRREWLLKLPR
jgi:hypothetical protein